MKKLAGRYEETSILQSLLESNSSEFLAIYGRRRIGKTHLIRTVFETNIVFETSGLLNGETQQQQEIFINTLTENYPKLQTKKQPQTWLKIFGD